MIRPPDAAEVRQNWEQLWQTEDLADRQGNVILRLYRCTLGRFTSTRLQRQIVESELGGPKGLAILEAGCGLGYVSRKLASQGASVVLLDVVWDVLVWNKIKVRSNGGQTYAIQASNLDLPFASNTFDVIWNEGVLEHFSRSDQRRMLLEFARVTRLGGTVLILVPHRAARAYVVGMTKGKQTGKWEYGYEEPLSTLSELVEAVPHLTIEREYSRGLLVQVAALRHFLGSDTAVAKAYLVLVAFVNALLWPLNRFPGYFLVTVCRKHGE